MEEYSTTQCESPQDGKVSLLGVRIFVPQWEAFRRDHGDWYDQRCADSSIVYAFPRKVADHRLDALFGITETCVQAESAYARLCSDFDAVAICRERPVVCDLLRPNPDESLDSSLAEMTDLGWTADQVRQAQELVSHTNCIRERLFASMGRLVLSPQFSATRNALRAQWESLPEDSRPPLPLIRSLPLAQMIDGLDALSACEPLSEFTSAFDQFCEIWRINGMITWELPSVDGPKWPRPDLPIAPQLPGQVSCDTPWHFALQAEDGLGNVLGQEHELLARERRINDHGSWKTYSQLFRVDFWEQVIRSQYGDRKRPRAFVTALENFVADIVELKLERVQKLRKLRSALRNGRRTSLRNWR